MTSKPPTHSSLPSFSGFASDSAYQAHAAEQEARRRRREEREKWTFDGLPTKEEQAAAQRRVEGRWICVVEGHEWQRVDRWPEWGCSVEQCSRCHSIRLIREPGGNKDTETGRR